MPERIVVIGLAGPRLLPEALAQARLILGSERHFAILELCPNFHGCLPSGDGVPGDRVPGDRVPGDGVPGDGSRSDSVPARAVLGSGGLSLAQGLDRIAAEPDTVAVLASGDPGFFGIVRPLADRFGSDRLDIHPAPSSVSLAFAMLGLAWDDALVVSAHGRPLDQAVAAACGGSKVAVLTSPDYPPETCARALLAAGIEVDSAAVCSQLGTDAAQVSRGTLREIAAGHFDPVSVLVLGHTGIRTPGAAGEPTLAWSGTRKLPAPAPAWGRPEAEFAHRDGMITKAEVRSVVLARLSLPDSGVVWDVGSGSGSVAVECAGLRPGVRVLAIERDGASCERIATNAASHGVSLEVVTGEAPGVLAELPTPDRLFIGGGGFDVLDAALDRLAPGGVAVATYTSWERGRVAAERLGNIVEVTVRRGERKEDGDWGRISLNPVFVVWGTR